MAERCTVLDLCATVSRTFSQQVEATVSALVEESARARASLFMARTLKARAGGEQHHRVGTLFARLRREQPNFNNSLASLHSLIKERMKHNF